MKKQTNEINKKVSLSIDELNLIRSSLITSVNKWNKKGFKNVSRLYDELYFKINKSLG